MRRIISASLLVLIASVGLTTTSCAVNWRTVNKGYEVRVNLPSFEATFIEFYEVENPVYPKNAKWVDLGKNGQAEAWRPRFDFRLHSEGAVIDTIRYLHDGVWTVVEVHKPNRPTRMEWRVTNMQNNAPMTMEVVVKMHVDGGPMVQWPKKGPAVIGLMHYNLADLREQRMYRRRAK